MRSSLLNTTHALAPISASHFWSAASAAKWSSWISTDSPAARRASATTLPPRDLSTKNVQGSGSRWDRGPDGIMGLIYGDAVVLRDGGDVFACSVAAHDDADRDAGLRDDRTAEGEPRVDHDDL